MGHHIQVSSLILSVLGLVRLNIILQGQRNTLYSSTEAPSLATTLEQNMKELDSDLLVTEVFVPIPTSSEEFILGPCFKGGSPSELVLFYPLEKGEKLLLHSLDSEWNKGELGSHGRIQVERGLIGLIDWRR